ncbi:MAG: hypothetical protein JSS82_00225 [Bacteroidetes bacterium]|nr:hypothetical protein [Bacteroidota bacterium]
MVLLVIITYTAVDAATCDSSLFNSITSFPSDSSAILLYSQGRRRCDEPTLDSRFKLQCPASNPFYTRYAFAIAAAGPDNVTGVCYQGQVNEVAPVGVDCRQYYQEPPNQPTTFIRTVSFAIATTRVYAAMPYTPINPSATLPFTFSQFKTSDPLQWCVNNTDPCSLATIESAPQSTLSCTSADVTADFGVFPNATEIMDHCGNYSDPPGDFIETTSCQMACCSPCGSATTNSSFIRPLSKPVCTFNLLGPPKYLVYGGARSGFANEPPGKDSVRFQQRLMTADGQPYFVGGLTTTTPVFINNSKHMRVSVGAVNSARIFSPGYLIICDLDPAEPDDQGPGNPYITSKVPSPCLQEIAPSVVDNAPLVAPPNADPSVLGAGTVPTAIGQGPGARVSFFFVSEERVTDLLSAYPSIAGMFLRDYLAQLFNGADAVDPATSSSTCPGTASTYFSQYVGVPGWQLDPSTLEPMITTVCQMSNQINYYAYKYSLYYNNTGDAALAEQMANEDPGFPDFLLPWWHISRPGSWISGNNLITDVGLIAGQVKAMELFIDLADSEYHEDANNQFLYSLTGMSQCFANAPNGTGMLAFSVTQIADTEDLARALITCTVIDTGVGVNVTDSAGSSFIGSGIVYAPPPGLGETISFGPYNLSFSHNTSAIYTPYITCSVILVDEIGQPYGNTNTMQCVRLNTAVVLAQSALNISSVPVPDDGIPQWAFWVFIAVMIGIIALVALGFVILAVMWYKSKSKVD